MSPSVRWKLLDGVGLTKTYTFVDPTIRDRFVVRAVALETYRSKRDVSWTIEGPDVTVVLRTSAIGVTELDVEFAKAIDDARLELLASVASDKDDWDDWGF